MAIVVYANKVDPNCVMQMTLNFESLKMTEDSENGTVKIHFTNPAEDTLNISGRINANDGKKIVLCLDNLEDYYEIVKRSKTLSFESTTTETENYTFENMNVVTENGIFSENKTTTEENDTFENESTTFSGMNNITSNEIDNFDNENTTESGTFFGNETTTTSNSATTVNQTTEETASAFTVANAEVFFGLTIPIIFILLVVILLGLILAWDWQHKRIFYKHITENAVRILPLYSNNNANTHTVYI